MSGPCAVWDLDLGCCDLPEDTDEELIARWQEVASQRLWAASGRRYGLCEVTVRPCLRSCAGSSLPYPYRDASGWHNAFCGCGTDCSCVRLCEIVLDGPVDSIDEVGVDGEVLDPSDYRLDKVGYGWVLVRTDGGCWPSCQDMSAAVGEPGAFWVTYEQGIALDELAIAAVSELTCNYVKACIPGCKTCKLPDNVVSVVRQGVALSFDNSTPWIKSLPAVANFLDTVNPRGLTSASSVWSPDIPQTRSTVAPSGS